MHLLTLDHFMTQPLSALATAAVAAADAYAEADGDGDGDGDAWNFVDTPSECVANVDADVAAIASRASRVAAEAATAAESRRDGGVRRATHAQVSALGAQKFGRAGGSSLGSRGS